MGLFNKLFKSDCEGLIEAYLQTYKKVKDTPFFQVAAESFEEETKMPKEFHYANTAVKARFYNQYQLEKVMELFMEGINDYIKRAKSLDERQLLLALLKAAHYVEAGKYINYNFEAIATKFITSYFGQHELSNNMDIQSLEEALSGIS
jgi:hypothetical protein